MMTVTGRTGTQAHQAREYVLPKMPLPSGVRFSFFAAVSTDNALLATLDVRPSLNKCCVISFVVGFLFALTNAKMTSLVLTANLVRFRFLPLTAGAFTATGAAAGLETAADAVAPPSAAVTFASVWSI